MTGRRALLKIASGLLSGRLLGHRGSRCSTTASGVLQHACICISFCTYPFIPLGGSGRDESPSCKSNVTPRESSPTLGVVIGVLYIEFFATSNQSRSDEVEAASDIILGSATFAQTGVLLGTTALG